MKVALVHDWLNGMRGGEKVLEVLCELFPDATIYTLLYEPQYISETIRKMKVIPSPLLSKLPFAKSKYRYYLPLFPMFIEQFNLRDYDLVISTSHCVAKGVLTGSKTLHICYCHTPMRYVWDMYYEYFSKDSNNITSRFFIPFTATYLRLWDYSSQSRVDHYIANSKNIAQKIKKYYRRDAVVIYPPVDCELFNIQPGQPEDYFLIVSALVPYKRIDLAIQCFNQLGYPLKIAGVGTEFAHLKTISKSNIHFLGRIEGDQLRNLYCGCRAFIFPGEEDFGITPLEAMSCGKPVIAYGKGGVLETLIPGKTGILFSEPTGDSLKNGIRQFKNTAFDANTIRNHVLSFDRKLFKNRLKTTLLKISNIPLF